MTLSEQQIIKNCELCREWFKTGKNFEIEFLDECGTQKWEVIKNPYWNVTSKLYRKKVINE